MVALAGELGAEVAVSDRLPDLGADDAPQIVVLFLDLLDDDQRDALEDWVDAGGTLVVTDPVSPFTPPMTGEFDTIDDLAPAPRMADACDIDALGDIDPAGVDPRNGGTLYAPGLGDESCVDDGSGDAYIVATDHGDGTVVAIGGAGMMVNASLAEGENAPVVSALVAPQEGTRLLVLEPGPLAGASTGRRTLSELIPAGVWRAILQLAVAFVVYAVWRSRRLGRPVPEPAPSPIAGSELVAAVGTLLDRSRSPGHAADLLRRDLRRFLGDHLGVPPDAPADVVAAVAAERSGADEADLRAALGGAPVTDRPGSGRAGRHDRSHPSGGPRPCLTPSSTRSPPPAPCRRPRPPTRHRPRPTARRRSMPPAATRAPPSCRCATRWARWSSARTAPCPAWSRRCWSAATCCSRACRAWPRR